MSACDCTTVRTARQGDHGAAVRVGVERGGLVGAELTRLLSGKRSLKVCVLCICLFSKQPTTALFEQTAVFSSQRTF